MNKTKKQNIFQRGGSWIKKIPNKQIRMTLRGMSYLLIGITIFAIVVVLPIFVLGFLWKFTIGKVIIAGLIPLGFSWLIGHEGEPNIKPTKKKVSKPIGGKHGKNK